MRKVRELIAVQQPSLPYKQGQDLLLPVRSGDGEHSGLQWFCAANINIGLFLLVPVVFSTGGSLGDSFKPSASPQ